MLGRWKFYKSLSFTQGKRIPLGVFIMLILSLTNMPLTVKAMRLAITLVFSLFNYFCIFASGVTYIVIDGKD